MTENSTENSTETSPESYEGMRLDRYVRRAIPGITQAMVEKLLRLGKIRVNDKKAKANQRLAEHDVVTLPNLKLEEAPKHPPKTVIYESDFEDLEACILWEDKDLLVIHKPAGLAMQGGSKTTRHLDGILQAFAQRRGSKTPYRLTHRLDKDTSGVCLIAKTLKMAAHLTTEFREDRVEKRYWALCNGRPEFPQGTIEAGLIKTGPMNRQKIEVDLKEGKEAITNYRVLKHFGKQQSWIECLPVTGRTHQIRVHMAFIHCPILGDPKYGTREDYGLCLHAREIRFFDLDGASLVFSAPPPPHINDLLRDHAVVWSEFA